MRWRGKNEIPSLSRRKWLQNSTIFVPKSADPCRYLRSFKYKSLYHKTMLSIDWVELIIYSTKWTIWWKMVWSWSLPHHCLLSPPRSSSHYWQYHLQWCWSLTWRRWSSSPWSWRPSWPPPGWSASPAPGPGCWRCPRCPHPGSWPITDQYWVTCHLSTNHSSPAPLGCVLAAGAVLLQEGGCHLVPGRAWNEGLRRLA